MKHILRCHDIVKTDFVRGENCTLYDAHGRAYTDLESGIWCTVLGHGHPRINARMKAQIDQIAHLGTRYTSHLAEEAAVEVLETIGYDDGACTLLSSGSEAVEFGIQAARRLTNRPRLLTFAESYLGAYGSGGRKPEDEWIIVDWHDRERADLLDTLEGVPWDEVGGFVFEPGGSGSAHVKFPPSELVDAIMERVRANAGLVVVNEVTTGMGRTGEWFGFHHYDLRPDVVAIGKGLGNGYPVSAVGMTRSLVDALESDGLHYAQSHQNDPLGCAVALEVIAELGEGDWIARGREMGAFFLKGLRDLQAGHPVVKDVRGRGMLLGLELHSDGGLSAMELYGRLLDQGFLVGYYAAGNLIRLDPALTIDKRDIERFLAALDRLLASRRMPAVD